MEEQRTRLRAIGCSKFYEEEALTRPERPAFDQRQAGALANAAKTDTTVIYTHRNSSQLRDLAAADAAMTG